MSRALTATYRLQVTRDLPLPEVRGLVPYLHDLGVSHLYLSPLLAAKAGSRHGYDVVDHTRLNPEVGTEDDLRALADDLHGRGMGIILDIVPNHMSASEENRSWDDVLERGRASRYADWFDIEWDAPGADGKVVLPVLGDEPGAVLDRGELRLHIRDSGSRLAYFESTFPLAAATLPREIQLAQWDPAGRPAAEAWASGPDGRARLGTLLAAQNYKLGFWRRAAEEINYRRFFEVNDLVALRLETEELFDATHRLILDWVQDGIVDGLRVDHVDGLRQPSWYLARLRQSVDTRRHPDAPARFPIWVEKILAADERLPTEWPVEGTTGYDFMNDVEELFLDPDGFAAIEARYRTLRRAPTIGFATLARRGKRAILRGALAPDVRRVARLAHRWRPRVSEDDLAAAIVEVIVHLDVYRTYASEPGMLSRQDRHAFMSALAAARECNEASPDALDAIEAAFLAPPSPGDDLRDELVARFQQTSGPAMAKGVEDTALYNYVPLASRNEVGGDPERALAGAASRAHGVFAERARDWPATMLATNTHDTKRSADIRARLDVLTTNADQWARHVARWRRLNKSRKQVVDGRPSPDTNTEYLYYQTLVALWPAPRPGRRVDDLPDRAWRGRARERLMAYMLKAAREAKVRTSWTESDTAYERALDEFVRATLETGEDLPFLSDVARLTARIAHGGFHNALARIVLHFSAPGLPDLYRGDELWNFTLVDPDNRAPVDFVRRSRLLADTSPSAFLVEAFAGGVPLSDDRVKLALTSQLMRFRRDHARLVRDGDYRPLLSQSGLFAFTRTSGGERCIAIARTRPHDHAADDVALPDELAGRWLSVLTGRVVELNGIGGRLQAKTSDLIPPAQPGELVLRAGG